MKILLIIPAYNEEGNIEKLVAELNEKCPFADYVIVNDCSTDNTLKICRENNFNHLNLCTNLGIGGGVQAGYVYAYENGYDCAIQIDGDGQHDPSYVKSVVDIIEKGEADIVIGSRFINCKGFQSSGMRRAGIKFLSFVIKFVCKADVKDVTSGFRAVNKKYIDFYSKNYADDYPEPEAIVAAKMNGAVIKETPVMMRERETGKSSISPLKSVYYMFKVTLAIIFARIINGRR